VIRLEVVLKSKWGSGIDDSQCERVLKRELMETIAARVEVDDLEITRVQFLGPKPKRRGGSDSQKD
jgi:hypothetical protein